METIVVGQTMQQAVQAKPGLFRITRRTFIVFGILLCLLLLYTAYAAIRHTSFADAVTGNPPSYCNATTWSMIVRSDNMFGVVSLNPLAPYTAYAAQAAIWCKKINEAENRLIIPANTVITIPTSTTTASTSTTTVKNALPMG